MVSGFQLKENKMDEVLAGVLVFIVAFVIGALVGNSVAINTVNEHCNNYKQYDTKEYKLICVKK